MSIGPERVAGPRKGGFRPPATVTPKVSATSPFGAGITKTKTKVSEFRRQQRALRLAKEKGRVAVATPLTASAPQPPRKPEKPEDVGQPPKAPKAKPQKKRLTFSKPLEVGITGTTKPKKVLSVAKTTATVVAPKAAPKRKKLTISAPETVKIRPKPKKAPSPKKTVAPSKAALPTVVYKERPSKAGGPVVTAPTTVTVTPQTTVAGASGNHALASKIDQLLRESREKKGKARQKSVFSKAKKEYSNMRKNSLAKLKAENKAIEKRERAKIKKLPPKMRTQARKKLKTALKEREAKLKKKFPSKIVTPGHLRSLLSSFRVLKI